MSNGVNGSMAPILSCKDINELAKCILGDAMPKDAGGIAKVELGLRPVAAVAAWLMAFKPEVEKMGRLGLLICGARPIECIDSGSWWSTLGAMLGNADMGVHAVLIGPEAEAVYETGLAKKGSGHAVHKKTLAEYNKENGVHGFDFMFLMHPGMEESAADWLGEDGVVECIHAGIPVGVCSGSHEERHIDAAISEALGLRCSDGFKNRFCDEPVQGLGQWYWVWSYLPGIDDKDPDEVTARLAMIMEGCCAYAATKWKEFERLGVSPVFEADIGQDRALPGAEDEMDTYIKLMSALHVRKATGTFHHLEEGLELVVEGVRADMAVVAKHPGSESPWIERMMWAMQVMGSKTSHDPAPNVVWPKEKVMH